MKYDFSTTTDLHGCGIKNYRFNKIKTPNGRDSIEGECEISPGKWIPIINYQTKDLLAAAVKDIVPTAELERILTEAGI